MPFSQRNGVVLLNFQRCPVGLRDQKGKAGVAFLSQCRSSKFNETRCKDQFPFSAERSLMKARYTLFSKRTFSSVLGGVTSNLLFGGKPPGRPVLFMQIIKAVGQTSIVQKMPPFIYLSQKLTVSQIELFSICISVTLRQRSLIEFPA